MENETTIKGYFKRKGKPGLEEFYYKKIPNTVGVSRNYLQTVMEENKNVMEITAGKKIITLYKFEVKVFFKGYLKSFKKSAYFRDNDNDNDQWKLMGRLEKTFN